MINISSYNQPSFQAKLYTHGDIENDSNFGLSKQEMKELRELAESIGTDEDKVIISATKSKLVSAPTSEYQVYQREANITTLIGDKIRIRTFEQAKVSAAYDDEVYWSSPDAEANQMKAEEMFNCNLFKIAKFFLETLQNK